MSTTEYRDSKIKLNSWLKKAITLWSLSTPITFLKLSQFNGPLKRRSTSKSKNIFSWSRNLYKSNCYIKGSYRILNKGKRKKSLDWNQNFKPSSKSPKVSIRSPRRSRKRLWLSFRIDSGKLKKSRRKKSSRYRVKNINSNWRQHSPFNNSSKNRLSSKRSTADSLTSETKRRGKTKSE